MRKLILAILLLITPLYALDIQNPGPIEQVIQHRDYALGYDVDTKCPLWVYYTMTAEEVDLINELDLDRPDCFTEDPLLKVGIPVSEDDYAKTGYDRGHLQPNKHAAWSKESQRESFYMTNMCPQTPALNRQQMMRHEKDIFELAEEVTQYGDLTRIVLPAFEKEPDRISGIAIPIFFYSIIQYTNAENTVVTEVYRFYNSKSPLPVIKTNLAEVQKATGVVISE